MANGNDEEARKKRAERLRRTIADVTSGKGGDPTNPRSFTDAAAAEAKRRAEEKRRAKKPEDADDPSEDDTDGEPPPDDPGSISED